MAHLKDGFGVPVSDIRQICCLVFNFIVKCDYFKKRHWYHQCCGSGSGSGSARIRNFLQNPEQDPELEVMDPAPDPELDFNLT
jgi:hypothetical protein